jgi:hypothetical protein
MESDSYEIPSETTADTRLVKFRAGSMFTITVRFGSEAKMLSSLVFVLAAEKLRIFEMKRRVIGRISARRGL